MRKKHRITPIGFIALGLITACSGTPEITRTGNVKNIIIRDGITPEELTVRTGDEVRWINQRMGDIRVEFIEPINRQISCNKGFHVLAGMGTDNTADLGQDQTASICFTQVGTKRYVVRMDSTAPSGEKSQTGTVTVE